MDDPFTMLAHSTFLPRNAAKARSKDTNSRIQKIHFGKQRLRILARGLGQASNTSNTVLRSSSVSNIKPRYAPEKISLAHASPARHVTQRPKKAIILSQSSRYPHRASNPSSDISLSKTRSCEAPGPYGTANSHSRVLREVNMTERTKSLLCFSSILKCLFNVASCFRAEVNRLLAYPDFAGLTEHRARQSRASSESFSGVHTPAESIFDDIEVSFFFNCRMLN
jgi:hypothetical protein